jgi:hypothetical protein
MVFLERLPVEREVEIVGEVRPNVLLGGNRVERVSQLLSVNIDRDVSATEELETSCMVQMKV